MNERYARQADYRLYGPAEAPGNSMPASFSVSLSDFYARLVIVIPVSLNHVKTLEIALPVGFTET